ncbi:MAG: hypothetical protein EBT34_14725, partial [Acetobacteraceae bacterium]|nr:hypothetical protein [Acetobacteraceae bacterium]
SARARLSIRVSEAAASAAGEGGGALAADTGAGATKAGAGLGGGMIFGFGALKRPPMRASPEKVGAPPKSHEPGAFLWKRPGPWKFREERERKTFRRTSPVGVSLIA